MNICIITIFDELNYGAYLQAYALGEKLKKNGHTIVYYEQERWRIKDSFHALHLRDYKNILFHFKLLNNYKKDWKLFDKTNDLKGSYDLVVIGSDELWNVRNYNFEHSLYYIGNGVSAKKCLTYAVSCNNCTAAEFLTHYPQIDNFSCLNDISVRDKQTYNLVTTLTDRVPTVVLDPTFLIEYTVNEALEKGEYILVYGYYFTNEEITKIRKNSKNYSNLKIISVGFAHEWCDKSVPGSPLEFLNYIKYAKTVITSTFHGTVFSIIFRKNFFTFGRDNLKITDVLEKFGLEDRNVTDKNTIDVSDSIIYNSEIEEKIRNWEIISNQYIDKYI